MVNQPVLEPAETPRRATCYRCFRPARLCLCPAIGLVDNQTLISIVQHPRERVHPFGTVRFAALGLSRVEVLVDHLGRLRRDSSALGTLAGAALLYPSPGARDITCLEPHERPRRLIVLDGTWHQARTLYRDMPVLATLPHLTLPSHHQSAFAIRKQPEAHCLSTIEAVVLALSALEPDTHGLAQLLEAFDTMQGQQLRLPLQGGRHRKKARPAKVRSLPRSLGEDYSKLVVAYAERRWGTGHDGLISCTAERPSTGQRFYAVLAQPDLTDEQLTHLGLSRSALDLGYTRERFGAEWSSFLGRDGILAAWSQSGLDILCDAAGRERAGVSLKSVYHRLGRHGGSLEQVVALEGLSAETPLAPEPVRGWARLDNSLRLIDFLRRGPA